MATAELGATLRETVYFEGVGLHTGEMCRVAVHPTSNKRVPCAITFRKGASSLPRTLGLCSRHHARDCARRPRDLH
jgi:UDP-3-O-acyl-N-acetylglucosamine deacetylase